MIELAGFYNAVIVAGVQPDNREPFSSGLPAAARAQFCALQEH